MVKKKVLKKGLALITSLLVGSSLIITAGAESQNLEENYDFVLFSQKQGESISINSNDISINGNVISNGTMTAAASQKVINGKVYEGQSNVMLDYHNKIEEKYFFDDDVDYIENSYTSTDNNTTVNKATFVEGDYTSEKNLTLNNTAIMTVDGINIDGATFNANNGILYSQMGDINVDSSTFSCSGLIYAPFGTVTIDADNVNVTGAIIAQKIVITANNVNINKNENLIKSLGSGIYTPVDTENLDPGDMYFKDVTSDDDIITTDDGLSCVKNQLVLTANSSTSYNDISALAESYGASIVGYIELTNDYQLEFKSDVDINVIQSYVEEINALDYIDRCTLNYMSQEGEQFYSNDAEWNNEWDETNIGGNDWNIEAIRLESALINIGVIDSENSSSADVDTSMLDTSKVGALDTSFDTTHEDLQGMTILNNDSGVKNCHGTHVAGTICAGFNNGKGITGISIKSKFYGYGIQGNTDSTLNTHSYVFKLKYALAWLITNNVKAINYSYGYSDCPILAANGSQSDINFINSVADEYEDFIAKYIDKGYDFLIIPAAGNDNTTILFKTNRTACGYVTVGRYYSSPSSYPDVDTSVTYGSPASSATVKINSADAKYSAFFSAMTNYKVKSRIVCVGAIDSNLKLCNFSDRGTRVDVVAPGANILSCVQMGKGYIDNNYSKLSGTSMAAPHVTGAIGLAYSVNPSMGASRMKSAIKSSASNILAIEDGINYKLLNVNNLVFKANSILTSLKNTGSDISPDQNNGTGIGLVVNNSNSRLDNVTVTAFKVNSSGVATSSEPYDSTVTDNDGMYNIVLPAGTYKLVYQRNRYKDAVAYYSSEPQQTKYIDTVHMIPDDSSEEVTVDGNVKDAITADNVSGVTVNIRAGLNNKTGNCELGKSTMTDENGNYHLKLSEGSYTAELSKNGYITGYANIVAIKDCGIQYATITPVLNNDEYRIVLTWGDTPLDLDSHLTGTYNGTDYHVYFGNKKFATDDKTVTVLDVDDVSSYGPETITFKWDENCGDCSYYVHDYTNRYKTDSTQLSYSSAKVKVYKGNSLVVEYNVPVSNYGVKWNVFSIIDGEIVPTNTFENYNSLS